MNGRRFLPPWTVEEQKTWFAVRDRDGRQLAYVYFEDEPGRRSAAKLLTKDECGFHNTDEGHRAGLESRLGAS